MAKLFHKIKRTGVFPLCWKKCIASPTFKKGLKSNVEKYGEVSLLSIVSKVFERCLFMHLYTFLKPYFSELKFRFEKQRSCVIQLLLFLDQVYKFVIFDDEIHVVYTDYEEASDNVDHGILLEKLYRMGIRGKVLNLLSSYLPNRTQRVRVDGNFSQEVLVISGVPQESLLASLLFVVYINDLPNNCKRCQPLVCADEAKFISINKSILQFEIHLSRFKRWSNRNKLPLDIRKRCHLDIGSSDKTFFSGKEVKKQIVEKDWVCWSFITSSGVII